MKIDTIIDEATQGFKQKFMDFCNNRDFSSLTPESAESMLTGLKSAIAFAGIAAFKSFIESYDCHGEETIAYKGNVFRYKDASKKAFLTPFGEVEISRRLYQHDRGGSSYIPLDHYWGMDDEYSTIDVRESILYSVAHNTPEETSGLLKKCALFHPSPTAVKHIIEKTGSFFETHRPQFKEKILSKEKIPKNASVLAVSMDGVNVLLNERGSGRGRPAERPKASDAAGYLSHYRNAMVGSLSLYKATSEGPKRLLSRYVSRMPESYATTFRDEFESELSQALSKCSKQVSKVLLVDGHRSIWSYIKSNPVYSKFKPLIDFFHTAEHLSKAAEALFGKGSTAGRAWYGKWRHRLLQDSDAALGILRSIDYYSKAIKMPKYCRMDLQTERTFFVRQKPYLNYASFVRRGLPIGSGPVEAACKSLVKTRLCRSGMRWSRSGGQRILTFRTYVKSNRWEKCWSVYKKLKKAA